MSIRLTADATVFAAGCFSRKEGGRAALAASIRSLAGDGGFAGAGAPASSNPPLSATLAHGSVDAGGGADGGGGGGALI